MVDGDVGADRRNVPEALGERVRVDPYVAAAVHGYVCGDYATLEACLLDLTVALSRELEVTQASAADAVPSPRLSGRCWVVGPYVVCARIGSWRRIGWYFARRSGAIRVGFVALMWGMEASTSDPERVPFDD